jgi:hypothetical protein
MLPDAYATDDGVAIHYRGGEIHSVVAETAGRFAYRVSATRTGEALEERLTPTLLETRPAASVPARLARRYSSWRSTGRLAAAASSSLRTGVE